MIELFPELKDLKGGKKQTWITNHLSLIWELSEQLGFDQAKGLLHMKDVTLITALRRHESGYKPAMTNGKRAIKKAEYVESMAYDLAKQMRTMQAQFEHSQQAMIAGLDMIERVLMMLRLALTDGKAAGKSQADFETEAEGITIMLSNKCGPLNLEGSPPTKRLASSSPTGGGLLLSRGSSGDSHDKNSKSQKNKKVKQ